MMVEHQSGLHEDVEEGPRKSLPLILLVGGFYFLLGHLRIPPQLNVLCFPYSTPPSTHMVPYNCL